MTHPAPDDRHLAFLSDDPALQAKARELHRRVSAYLGHGPITPNCYEPLELSDAERHRVVAAHRTAASGRAIALELIEAAAPAHGVTYAS